jgi:WD40 repeat protein
VPTGELLSSFDGHGGLSGYGEFAAGGSTVYTIGEDGVLRHWDATTGEQVSELHGVGYGPVSVLADGLVLVSDYRRGEASLLAHRRSGELGAVETCDGDVPESAAGPITRDALGVASGRAVFAVHCAGGTSASMSIVSLERAELIDTFDGQQGAAVAISPDGERFVRQEGEGTVRGPLVVRDVRTGAESVTLEGLCRWDEVLPEDEQPDCQPYPEVPFAAEVTMIRWSPDGSMIAASLPDAMAVWDAESGRLLSTEQPDPDRNKVVDAIFTPDSRRLVVSGWDGLTVLSAETGEVVESHPADMTDDQPFVSLVGFSPDDARLFAVGGAGLFGSTGNLTRIDVETFERVTYRRDLHDDGLLSAALSPDATRIATGAASGLVRIWGADSGELLHEVPLVDTEVRGLAFIDDRRLAVTPSDGDLLIVTTDPEELIELVRSTLPRGFRPNECARFNFGDDCPTLAELRGDAA